MTTNFLLDPTQQEQQQHWLLEQLRRKTPQTATTTTTVEQLARLTKLDLGQLGLTCLPVCLPAICPHLKILFCPENNFVELPAVVGRCLQLTMVSFKNCGTLTSIHPDALQGQLRWCILTGNQLTAVPTTIGRCTKLQKLMLSGNRLQDLPAVVGGLPNLELLRVACNNFPSTSTAVASIVTFLQSCPKLKWVSFAGNPFVQEIRRNSSSSISSHDNNEEEGPGPQFPIFDDPTLEAETWPILGRGASGIIRKVTWTKKKNNNNHNNKDDREDERMEVAVKTFVGTLTSDGSPHDEKDMAKLVAFRPSSSSRSTTTSTTTDPALIHIYGETKRTGALVMEYLPGYTALASPPNFDTCTRDVYDHHHHSSSRSNRTSLTAAFCWQIAMDTLRVVTKLHEDLGISHGDLYAHNILIRVSPADAAASSSSVETTTTTTTTPWSGTTNNAVKVSDFGAAYCYKNSVTQDDEDDIDEFQTLQRSFARLVEQIELRAYAVLVEELHALVQIAATQQQHHQQQDDTVHHTSTVANIPTSTPVSTIQHSWKELLQACSEQPSTTDTVTTATPTTVTFRTLAQQFHAV